MTAINPTLPEAFVPATIVEAGKAAFAAGKESAGCPYPAGDIDSHEQRYLWLRGHAIASAAAKGRKLHYADLTPDELLKRCRLLTARQEFGLIFAVKFEEMMGGVDDRGFPDIVREEILAWLCRGAASREDFIGEVQSAADKHDWPDEGEGE
jgi:hypothetical protein